MKLSKSKLGKLLWVLGILVVFQACYPGGSIPITDLDTTSTIYNSDDLATPPASAAIIWDVAEIVDEEDPDNNIPYNGEVDDQILNTTLLELVELYGEANVKIISETDTPSPTPANSNVEVIVAESGGNPPDVEAVYASSITLRKQYVGIIYPGYPWWPGGWWGGWYPCWYCGYPPTVSYTRYDVGTVISELYDARQFEAGAVPSEVDPSWIAINRGLLSSSTNFNGERVVTGIRQAFTQSPYLDPNP